MQPEPLHDAPVWSEPHNDECLSRAIAVAEEDVRKGRERTLAEATELLEQKWTQRRSTSA